MNFGRKTLIFFIGILLSLTVFTKENNQFYAKNLYNEMKLNGLINYQAFSQAIDGFNKTKNKEKNILTIVDFSLPSTEKRMFVLDLDKKTILLQSYVAHGKNTGDLYAKSFSNKSNSNKSSVGLFLTEGSYNGRNGYSLRLNGLEKGVNDNAKKRNIVVHGADYANPKFIETSGRLGRSLGCFAVPESVNAEIINTIKGKSILYVYSNAIKPQNQKYATL
jgi:hypothetical protein